MKMMMMKMTFQMILNILYQNVEYTSMIMLYSGEIDLPVLVKRLEGGGVFRAIKHEFSGFLVPENF